MLRFVDDLTLSIISCRREKSSFLAPPLAKAGSTVVIVGYDLAPAGNREREKCFI